MIEAFNDFLYNTRDQARKYMHWGSFLGSLIALGLLVYGYGFHISTESFQWAIFLLEMSFLLFVVIYFFRLIYSIRQIDFLKATWFEGLLMLIILVNTCSRYIFNYDIFHILFIKLGLHHFKEFYQLFVTFYMVIILGIEFTKAASRKLLTKLRPESTFILSFLTLIGVGTGLLMLPTATKAVSFMPFFDALFTSVSASCVTGLVVVETGTYFTFKGQLIILILMQLGGIGIVSFAVFFTTMLTKGVGLKHQSVMQNILSTETLVSTQGLLRRIIAITFLIELMASSAIFMTWGDSIAFKSLGDKIFASVFHGISAFCNAGFSLFPKSLATQGLQDQYLLHIIFAVTIIAGGLGFTTLRDVFSPRAMRERMKYPWKDWKLSSKIAIYASLGLILLGTIMIFLLESNSTLESKKPAEKAITAFFQSVTARTAGFNTIEVAQLCIPALLILLMLMFIGASPGSTGGGIKTTTFVLIAASAIATIKGKKRVELSKRTISPELLYKAFSIFAFSISYNFLSIFLLSITDPGFDIIRIIFEQVSAFATVGLSTGITSELSELGRLIIIFSMFIGRIGPLTLALVISTKPISDSHVYPNAHVMVG